MDQNQTPTTLPQNQPLNNTKHSSLIDPNNKIYGIIAIIIVSVFVIVAGAFLLFVYAGSHGG